MTTSPTIPDHTILDIAGEGGMGIVYRAQNDTTKRTVAIKMLTAAQKPEAAENFQREAQIIAGLEHPHILPIYDIGRTGENEAPYMVMRYVEGGSVADQLRKQTRLDEKTAVSWLSDIADALDLAHSRGLVHKDVKPSNMLLDSQQNVYLTDFGIAGMDSEEGSFAGSAAYMAPEQGKGEATDRRTDVYALAVSLFEMVTGEKPYMAETALGTKISHINDPIPDPQAVNPELSVALADLIVWGMSKDAADRPQTAAAFGQALKQALKEPTKLVRPQTIAQPTTTTEPNTSEHQTAPQQPAPSNNLPLILAGVVSLLIVVAIILFTIDPFGWNAPTPTPVINNGQATIITISSPTPPPTPDGQLYADDFNENVNLPSDTDDAIAIVDNTLVFNTSNNGRYATFSTQTVQQSDVNIEVDLLPSARAEQYELLLSCRWQDAANYTAMLIRITPDTAQAFLIKLVDGESNVLASTQLSVEQWSTSEHLHGRCLGSELSLHIDGEAILDGVDPAPQSGDVALMTRPIEAETPHQIIFDNILVTVASE